MRPHVHGAFLKLIVAPAVTTWAESRQPPLPTWQDITYTIVNTTTPIPEDPGSGVASEGVMIVSCNAVKFHALLKGVTRAFRVKSALAKRTP